MNVVIAHVQGICVILQEDLSSINNGDHMEKK